MGKLAMVGNCAKEVLKKNKTLLRVIGSTLGIGTLGAIAIKTLGKIEQTKIDYYYKGMKSGVDAGLEIPMTAYTDPSKDIDTIIEEIIEKHTLQEFNKK